jgi:hypothetical protein
MNPDSPSPAPSAPPQRNPGPHPVLCCGSAVIQCGSGSSLLVSLRFRIRIQGAKPMRIHADPDPVYFLHKKILKDAIGQKTYLRMYNSFVWKAFIRLFWSMSMLLDPDTHSQYGSGSGSRTAKSMRIRNHNTIHKTARIPTIRMLGPTVEPGLIHHQGQPLLLISSPPPGRSTPEYARPCNQKQVNSRQISSETPDPK